MTAKVRFRGGWTCSCVTTSLPLVEQDMLGRGLITFNIDIYQLGYNTLVTASAGTHAAGGCTDVGQYSKDQIEVWREWGWTMQHRTTQQGFDFDHAHGWPYGCPHLSSDAQQQNVQWNHKQNGLTSKGAVAGLWPIPDWKTAITRKDAEMPSAQEVAKAVLTIDGLIDNVFTNNPANKDVALRTALTETYKRVAAVDLQLDRVESKLDALIAAAGQP
jgi:hypothetical protein